ncbi:aspartate--ammonia ligase [Pseudidiomarina sediminum]|uniref:Aspartate--ammonia ligase n=1 Tax=Pseudidiomarina sediminum TaxID=431675 RepID=A0A432Z954_9GAMM|nr:aspartate--ammonia ligase [Pseudidiomarina sediminum]RUO74455.1 aspartate--ammonia ligase [Pseudidiomarina sediminum]
MLQSPLALQSNIAALKHSVTKALCENLNLIHIQAPLIVAADSGMQDTLSGTENAVTVHVKAEQKDYEVVHSLAKWKRAVLGRYQLPIGAGIVTHMLALRPDEERLSERHSVQVDQWDWEQVLDEDTRSLATLKQRVTDIYTALRQAAYDVELWHASYAEQVYFIHSEELRAMYPRLTAKQREREITKMHKAVFIIGIGGQLTDGSKHDARAADYDDWSTPNDAGFYGLNGDLLVWHEAIDDALELSSMGIRVTPAELRQQLELTQQTASLQLPWHQQLMAGELPATIGGGIGQSRVAMWLLRQDHITKVQAPSI